jgi:hypothetical protein
MILTRINDTVLFATLEQIAALAILKDTRKGGVASVQGYVPTSGWIDRPVQNIQFISRISTERLYRRHVAALTALSYGDIADTIAKDSKLAAMSHTDLVTLFETRRDSEVASKEKTLSGDRSGAHRAGHDRCYIAVDTGIKVNLVTEKDKDGIKQPVLNNGFPMVATIMVSAFFLKVKTVKEGTRKEVKSGAPVRMSNIIKSVLNQPGLNLRMLSLKTDNFDLLTIDRNTIVPDQYLSMVA